MENDKEYICVASRGRNTAPDGGIEQHLEPCPIPGKTNCLTTVAKDNLLLQRPRGKKQSCIFVDKSPTLTQSAWEQNNLIVENACLTARRTEYGKIIRQQYEAHEIQVPRKAIQRLEPRTDGKTNTITTVQKDNLIIQLNPSTESHGAQPYQQNRVYHPDGKTPALMQGHGGQTLNTITDAGGGTYPHTPINPCRVRTLTDCAGLVQMGCVGNSAIQNAG